MSALTVEMGLNGDGYFDGMKRAEAQTKSMENAVNRMIQKLTAQHAELSGNTSELTRYQAIQNRATGVQLAALKGLQESIDVEKRAKEALQAREAKLQALANAENKRQNSIKSLLQNIQAEEAAVGKTSAELKIMELRSLGASSAQISMAKASLEAAEKAKVLQAANEQNSAHMQKLHGQYEGLLGSLRSYAAAYLSIAGIRGIGTNIDEYIGIENSLKRVTAGQAALGVAMQETFNIAQQTGSAWSGVASTYQKVARNSDKLNLTQQQVGRVTETISKAAAMTGGSAESVDAALTQLGQALDSGVLRGEEFNSMAEQAPVILQTLGQALGKTVGELRFMAAEGKLTSDIVAKAMLDMSSQVDTEYAKSERTISQSMQGISNAWMQFTGEAGKATGVAKGVAVVADVLSKNLDVVAVTAFAGAIGLIGKSAYGAMAGIKANVSAVVTQRQANIAATAETLRRTQVERVFIQTQLQAAEAEMARMTGMARVAFMEQTIIPLRAKAAAAQVAETAATNAATVATSRLAMAKSMLMGAMGGPAGLVIAGLSVGAMYYAMKDNTDAATGAMNQQIGTVAELNEKIKGLNEAEKARLKLQVQGNLDSANQKIDDFESKIRNLKFSQMLDASDGDGKIAFSWNHADEINKSFDSIKSGASSVGAELQRLEKTGQFTSDQLMALNKSFAESFDPAVQSAKEYGQQLDVLNGKTVTTTVEFQSASGKTIGAEMSSAEALIVSSLQGMSKEFVTAEANYGKSNEQLRIQAMEAELNALATKGATAQTMALAAAEVERAKASYATVEQMKLEDEERKKSAQMAAQNRQYIDQTIAGLDRQIQTLAMSTEQLTAFDLAAAGATKAEIAKTSAMQSVIDAYQRQQAVMADLEGLDKQIARLGKSEIEVKLMDLRDKGANQQQLDYARKQLEYLQQYKTANTSMKSSTDLMKTNAMLDGQSATSFASGVDRFGKSVDNLLGKSDEQVKDKVPQVQYFGPRGSNATETLAASKPTGLANLGTIKLELGDGNQKLSELIKTDSESAKTIMKLFEEASKRQMNETRKRMKN